MDGGDRNGSSGIIEGKENETGLGLINEAEGHLWRHLQFETKDGLETKIGKGSYTNDN